MPFPFFDALRLLFEGGLHLAANATDEERARAPADGRCPACLKAIARGAVRCGACDTPHHAKCYSAGGCAIGGCGADAS